MSEIQSKVEKLVPFSGAGFCCAKRCAAGRSFRGIVLRPAGILRPKEARALDKTLTSMELEGFSKLLTSEANAIRKYKAYAAACEDPALCELCEDMAARHRRHYDTILSELKA